MTQTTSKNAKGKGKGKGWQPPKQRRSSAPLLWGLAVLLGVLAIAAVVVTRNGDKPAAKATSETAPVTVSGTALPAFAESGTGADAAVGKAAPGLRGTDFDGKPVAVTADGKPKLVMFVAHWCPHCQREVPLIAQWLKGGMPAGVELYSVATSTSAQQPNYPPSAWLTRAGWQVPVLTDDDASSAAQAYGLTSFPYFVFIDAGGKVVQRLSGEQPVSTLQAELAKLAKPAT